LLTEAELGSTPTLKALAQAQKNLHKAFV